jgi:hypothetical protein
MSNLGMAAEGEIGVGITAPQVAGWPPSYAREGA